MPFPDDIRPPFQDVLDTFVSADTPFIQMGPTSSMKILWLSRETGGFAVLVNWKAGHVAPPHKHLAGAHAYIISGCLKVRDGMLKAGDYTYEPAGIVHDATTAVEDTLYFFAADGPVLYFNETNFTGYLNAETLAKRQAAQAH
jgi:quercetin dioxygenase-like cupin family protein